MKKDVGAPGFLAGFMNWESARELFIDQNLRAELGDSPLADDLINFEPGETLLEARDKAIALDVGKDARTAEEYAEAVSGFLRTEMDKNPVRLGGKTYNMPEIGVTEARPLLEDKEEL